jgi:hypothetical protein
MMPFNATAGGHRFDFISGLCMKCGMSREKFENEHWPRCSSSAPKKVSLPIDDVPTDAA